MIDEDIHKVTEIIAEKGFNALKRILCEEIIKFFPSDKRIEGNIYNEIHVISVDKICMNLMQIVFTLAKENLSDEKVIAVINNCYDNIEILNKAARKHFIQKYTN